MTGNPFSRYHSLNQHATQYGQDVIVIGPDRPVDIDLVERVASNTNLRFAVSEQSVAAMSASQSALDQLIERNEPIYGINTGFGPFVQHGCHTEQTSVQGLSLIAHLAAGAGPAAPIDVVRATIFLRAATISHGFSGVGPRVSESLLSLLTERVHPFVPVIGSVGASGDLVPLAHIARVLIGEGSVINHDGHIQPASPESAIALSARESLAIVNGTSFSSAWLALALARAERLVDFAEALTGWIFRAMGCRAAALDATLHACRGHLPQQQSAQRILAEAERFGPLPAASRPLQEPYSIRCAPQVLGACRENIAFARRVVVSEINGVNDNPLICSDPPRVLHGGNFHGQALAFAGDTLNAAITQTAVLAERQIALMCDPQLNGGAPLLLSPQPGSYSGMAGAQLTATAMLAQMRHEAAPSANSSIPTNGFNQDIVPMSAHAAMAAYEQTPRLATVLAVLSMCMTQWVHLGDRDGRATPAAAVPPWTPAFQPMDADRPLHVDIQRITGLLMQRAGS